jgi:glycosyltransferase involved in cell wall biosynthesis
VRLDEPGGGILHVRFALDIDAPGLEMGEVALDPRRLRLSPVGWRRSVRALRQRLRAGEVDIIHAYGVRAGLAALLASRRLQIKRVILIQGLHSIRRAAPWSAAAVRFVNRRILRAFDRVMVLSQSDEAAIVGPGLAPADRVRLVRTAFIPPKPIPRADARDVLGITGDRPVVVWIGRFGEEKDPLTFVRAVTQLRDEVSAVMIGDGPLVAEARSIGEGAGVLFTGWLDDPSVGYVAGDILVNSSRWEGLPVTVLEAASVGLRLVLSDRPGNRDVAAMGVPARTFPFGDAAALSAAIKEEITSPAPEGTAREMVLSRFNPATLKEDLLRVYGELGI